MSLDDVQLLGMSIDYRADIHTSQERDAKVRASEDEQRELARGRRA